MSSTPPPTPRWVKVFALLIGALLVIAMVLHLSGHGMGNHVIR